MRQLRDVAGFSFVRKFEMIDVERGRTAYFLMFGTRHRKGLSVMKDAMWALDPISGMRFAGTAGAQEMLFELEPDFGPCDHVASLTSAATAAAASACMPGITWAYCLRVKAGVSWPRRSEITLI